MAATVSLIPIDLSNQYRNSCSLANPQLKFRQLAPLTLCAPGDSLGNFIRHDPNIFRTRSTSSSDSPSPSPAASYFQYPFRIGRFLTNQELEQIQFLDKFRSVQELNSGSMLVRVMRPEELDITVELLAESFAESMFLPVGCVSLLKYLVKQHLIERRAVMPHAATLIGFYGEKGEDGQEPEEQLAGTVEVSFNANGANASLPSPMPPKCCPYICNMTVKKHLRRYS